MDNKFRIKKLKILAAFVAILLVVFICVIKIVGSKNNNAISNDNKTSENGEQLETVTEPEIDYEVLDNSRKIMRDYRNPTPDDQAEAYDLYGYDYVSFSEDGLVVEANEYEGTEKRLITDVWPDEDLTANLKKPEVGTLDIVEVGETYVIIQLRSIKESEAKKYISQIKGEYSNSQKVSDKRILYLAQNDAGSTVRIKYSDNYCIITYSNLHFSK